jgi:hypothetical protein
MICHECTRAAQTAGICRWYCEGCIHCGARLLQCLREKPEAKRRQEEMLGAWVARGHSRERLIALARGPMAVQPSGLDEPGASESRKTAKRR